MVRLSKEDSGLSPGFVDSPEKRQKLDEFLRGARAVSPELREWLKRCAAAGGNLHLILGMPQAGGSPFAAVCGTMSRAISPPDDLRSNVEPAQLLSAIRPFDALPHVVTFLGDAWRGWYDLFRLLPPDSWVHTRFMNAVRICVHRKLSRDLVVGLLEFEELGKNASAFVFELKGGLYVGCFASPTAPGVYALQKIPSDAALGYFNEWLSELGIETLENPASDVPHFELLKRIVIRELSDPAGFR